MTSEMLVFLEGLVTRVTAAQLLAAGTSAWAPLRRLAVELRRKVEEEYAERDRLVENDYHFEEGDPFDG